jgi:hypothetical protein
MVVTHFIFNFGVELVFPGAFGLGAKLPLFGWLDGAFVLVAVIVWGPQSR